MKKAPFGVNDLIKAIEFLAHSIYSSDDIESYSKSPIHKLVYNEILNYTKEELESSTANGKHGYNLFQMTLRIRNSYILSAFLKQGAFIDKLDKKSQWLLKSVKEPSNEIFTTIHYIEDDKYRGQRFDENKELHYWLFQSYIKSLSNPEQIEVLDKYLKEFGKRDSKKIAEYITKSHNNDNNLNDYLVSYLRKNGVNLSENTYLDHYLPKDERSGGKFFISSTNLPKLQRLLEYGFRFDEKNYTYQGNNLFIAAIESRREVFETILPYLSNIQPKKGTTLEEQNAYIDSLSATHPNTHKWIQKLYHKLLLEQELEVKSDDKKKIKI